MPHSSHSLIIAKHADVLAALRLTNLPDVKSYQGELIKNHRGRRDILKISTTCAAGRPLTLFLKRNWKPYKKDGISSLLHHGRVWSQSRQEWENSLRLDRAGLRTAGLVAYGEDCGPLWERFSFLVTEAADGEMTLADFLSSGATASTRRLVLDQLAGVVRRLHDAGLASPDLYTRHIFVTPSADPPHFCLIDMARLDQSARVSRMRRARDLAALNISAPLRFVSAAERVRFLLAYAGHKDKRLAALIEKRMKTLLQRRKFRDFAQD